MKKLFIGLLVLLLMTPAFGSGFLYLQAEKIVNGSWVFQLPTLEMSIVKDPLIIDWESSLDFTMPRGGSIINHHSAKTNLNVGVQRDAFFGTVSLGIRQYFEGNDDGIPAGSEFYQTLRLGVEF